MHLNYFVTNCRKSDRMSSNGLARSAETCETRDDSPSLNLGRGKQGCAPRTASTDLRVARLRFESVLAVEVMTVSSILNCESGIVPAKWALEDFRWASCAVAWSSVTERES